MEAEQFGWGMAEGHIPESAGPIMEERAVKGLKMKFLIPETVLTAGAGSAVKNVEIRGLAEIPAIIVLTDKEAAVCLRLIGGRMDYTGFFGKYPMFLNWAKELFLYYWDKGKRV